MKTCITPTRLVGFALAFAAVSAQAHTGHTTHSLMDGLRHPLGTDHLLAMVAVGLWSITSLPTRQAWQGPATFLLALIVSAFLGAMGVALPWVEHGIALSVVMFGLMLMLSARPMPRPLGLAWIAVAASLHGLAHGSEAPATGFTGYAVGFMFTTALLHLGGIGIGQAIGRLLAERSRLALTGLGTVLGGSGLVLYSQLG